MKGQRLWRTISLDNKQNQDIFKSKNNCIQIGLFEIIKFGLFEKKLNAFASDNFNEVDKTRFSEPQLVKKISFYDSSEVTSFDAQGNETKAISVEKRYLYNKDISTYLLKEDWVINSHSGQLEKKIVAIAPLLYEAQSQKVVPLFWLYYNEWKELFNSFEAKNYYTDERLTYRGILEKKYFISQVSKASNIFDRSVKSDKHGIEIFLEGEVIKEKMLNSEKDMFQH